MPLRKPVGSPFTRLLKHNVIGPFACLPKPDKLSDYLIRTELRRDMATMQPCGMGVQAVTQFRQPGVQRSGILNFRCSQVPCTPQLIEQSPLVRLVAVQLKAGVPHSSGVKPTLHHLQRSHLFRNEKHRLPIGDSSGNNVGDSLTFAGSGRPLNHHITSTPDLVDSQSLTAVAVYNVQHFRRGYKRIDFGVFGDHTVGTGEALGESATNQGPVAYPCMGGPCFRIKVTVHQELGEREKPQSYIVILHRPARLSCHRIRNAFKI